MAGDINVMALVKGEEKYVFLFDDDSRSEALRTLGRYASDTDLSFSWYDAAVLSQKMRRTNPGVVVENELNRVRLDDPVSHDCHDEYNSFPLFDDLPPTDDQWIDDSMA